MISDFNLEEYVTFKVNVNMKDLLALMYKSKTYFHPRLGEHFGISIVEAMSAGLIPIIPNVGGQTEFVPSKYQYGTIEEAASIIESAFGESDDNERIKISDSVEKFSATNYKCRFQQIINNVLLEVQS